MACIDIEDQQGTSGRKIALQVGSKGHRKQCTIT